MEFMTLDWHPSFDQLASARHLDRELRCHSYKLLKPRVRRSAHANAFSVRMVDMRNSLPEEVVQAPTLNAFKARLDRAWMNIAIKDTTTEPRARGT